MLPKVFITYLNLNFTTSGQWEILGILGKEIKNCGEETKKVLVQLYCNSHKFPHEQTINLSINVIFNKLSLSIH